MWTGGEGDGSIEWRGKVQHVVSGEAHHFQDWPTLTHLLLAMLPGRERALRHDEADEAGVDAKTG
jgi:hypothetical protein